MGEDNLRIFQAILLVGRNKPSLILLSKYHWPGNIFQTIVNVCAGGSQVFPLVLLSYMNHFEIIFPGTFPLSFFPDSVVLYIIFKPQRMQKTWLCDNTDF